MSVSRAKPKPKDENSLLSRTPFKEVYYSSRAILPLIICLVCIVLFILKKPLPKFSFYLKVSLTRIASPQFTHHNTDYQLDCMP